MLVEKMYNEHIISHTEVMGEFRDIFTGKRTANQISAFLTAVQFQQEIEEYLLGTVLAMLELGKQYDVTYDQLFDNCGTGGDKTGSFNISTTVAFILGAAGVNVAKHGNRSVTSKSGSSDLLEALGVTFPVEQKDIIDAINNHNIAFLFAPQMHERLSYVKDIRKELRIPTVFNLAGPLANPMPITHQLMGVYQKKFIPIVANVLNRLGRKRAMVICGEGGVDEALLAGETSYAFIENGIVSYGAIRATDFGFKEYNIDDIRGGTPEENSAIFLSVLSGERSAYFDTVIYNAAIGLYVAEKVETIAEGVMLATELVDSKKAFQLYESMKAGENK